MRNVNVYARSRPCAPFSEPRKCARSGKDWLLSEIRIVVAKREPCGRSTIQIYQINMSDMEAFQNRAFVSVYIVQCTLCYGNLIAPERPEKGSCAHSLLIFFAVSRHRRVLSSGFVNKANTHLHRYARTHPPPSYIEYIKCRQLSAAVEESHYTINSLSIRHYLSSLSNMNNLKRTVL